jgi:hypothetical protein
MAIKGSCHCGATQFEISEAPANVTRCTSSGSPDFEYPRISINARLLDEFDLDAVPVRTIDGKNLW